MTRRQRVLFMLKELEKELFASIQDNEKDVPLIAYANRLGDVIYELEKKETKGTCQNSE